LDEFTESALHEYKKKKSDFQDKMSSQNVKGSLRKNIDYWENEIKANNAILEIVKNGYKIPLLETPNQFYSKNNKSALENKKFVTDSISEMISLGTLKQVTKLPHCVNPLSVSTNSSGKKRLILDLTYVNEHVFKEKIKFDDWNCFEIYLNNSEGYV